MSDCLAVCLLGVYIVSHDINTLLIITHHVLTYIIIRILVVFAIHIHINMYIRKKTIKQQLPVLVEVDTRYVCFSRLYGN